MGDDFYEKLVDELLELLERENFAPLEPVAIPVKFVPSEYLPVVHETPLQTVGFCADCGAAIGPFVGSSVVLAAERVVEMTMGRFGRALCVGCSDTLALAKMRSVHG